MSGDSEQLDYNAFSWDTLAANLLTGGEDGEASPPSPVASSSSQQATFSGPRVSGGFAATGRAAPLAFDDLRVGTLMVRHDDSAAKKPLLANVVAIAGGSAAGAKAGGGRDLLAALRNRNRPAPQQQLPSQGPSPPPPNDGFESIEDAFVPEEEAKAQGLSQSELYRLATTMLLVTGLGRADHTVLATTAANDKPVTIRNFGTTSALPTERCVYYRAGRVEEALFVQWRADPNGQLKAILARGPSDEAAAASSATLGTKRPREAGMTVEAILSVPRSQAETWWAVKGLLVRYVPAEGEESDPNFGKKGAIVECSRKDNRVTIKLEGDATTDGDASGAFALVRCPIAAVDTVVPKVGGRAMILRSDLAGEIVTVAARSKDKTSGDPLVTVVVDGESVVLKAEEICQLA